MANLIWKIMLDFLILACIGIPLLALTLWVEPYRRGYFEFDLSLRLPYKEATVPEAALAASGFGLIIATVIITEIIRDKRGKGIGEKFLSGSVVSGWVWESYTTIGIYTFGAECQQITCDLTKYVTGSLRPHFYDVCQPMPNYTSPLNELGYIQDYECTGTTDEFKLKDMRISFPSAHASFALYTALFFIFYVQVKGKWRGSKLLRHAFQLAALIAAWYAGISRVLDNMHHGSDVLAGFLIGAMYAVVVFVYVLKPKKYGSPVTLWQDPPSESILPRPALAPQIRD